MAKSLFLVLASVVLLVVAPHAVLLVRALDNGVALTPPMGFNTWNAFRCNVSEELVKQMADAVVDNGLRELGWEYINALADYVHSLGLKLGIYSDAGDLTCARYPGSYGYEAKDAEQYAKWEVDYLKYDWCYMEDRHPEEQPRQAYARMRDALNATGRPIVFSLCSWGRGRSHVWGKDVGNLWRTTPDLFQAWDFAHQTAAGVPPGYTSIMEAVTVQADYWKNAGPGSWNDPDMLVVGLPGMTLVEADNTTQETYGGLTLTEQRTHFALWCMLASPLLAGNDLRNLSAETLAIYKAMIAVNQDPLGIPAQKVWEDRTRQIWRRPLVNNSYAFLLLNTGDTPTSIPVVWARDSPLLQPNLRAEVRDLWKREDLGTWDGSWMAERVEAHEAVVIGVRFVGSGGEEGEGEEGSKVLVWLGTANLGLMVAMLGVYLYTQYAEDRYGNNNNKYKPLSARDS
eukprot:jgi/Chlat1/4147/Chrsp27S04258